ncbi:hypothetical protein RhiTH_010758 [Rhizoctonia solani]
MAGGHASSRVGKYSGSMKFRPGVSIRRPTILHSPAPPTHSGSAIPSTPSKLNAHVTQESSAHDHIADSSDTEAGPSRGTIPLIMTRSTSASRVNIAPGISRPLQPSRPVEPQAVASTSRATESSNISVPTVVSTTSGDDNDATQTSLHLARPTGSDIVPSDHLVFPHQVTSRNISLPTPLSTQLQPSQRPFENLAAALIQPGSSQTSNITGIPTPASTQLPITNFPVDPAILEFTNLPQGNELFAPPGMPQIVVEPPLEIRPELADGTNLLPAPPLLPVDQDPGENEDNEPSTGDSATATKPKRGRQVPTKEPKPRKRRKTAKSHEGIAQGQENNIENEQPEGKPRRRRSTQKKARKPATLEEKIEVLEQEAAKAAGVENAEPLDPTTATMASLCDSDIPNGRLSSKYLEKGIAYVKYVEERRQRIVARTAERLKNLRQSGLDVSQPQPPPLKKPEPTPVPPGTEVDEDGNPTAGPSKQWELGASLSPSPEPEAEPGQPEETFIESAAAPQIRFVNGEMVLDEDSQFYDRAGATAQDEDSMVVVDEADSTRFSNSNSFMKKAGSRGSRWTADETELFYWCLSAFGEDYENIARYLGRTPLQCKNKTKSEDRRGNEKRITLAIKTRIPLDLEEFGRITGRDFSGPPPEIRAPVVPPRAENEEQEPVPSSGKAKAASATPSTTPRKNRKANSHAEEEIMTMEEYERDGKDD